MYELYCCLGIRGEVNWIKLEYFDSDIYQVTARYVEIDGQPYVMELLRKMDEEFLVDLENRDRLME